MGKWEDWEPSDFFVLILLVSFVFFMLLVFVERVLHLPIPNAVDKEIAIYILGVVSGYLGSKSKKT